MDIFKQPAQRKRWVFSFFVANRHFRFTGIDISTDFSLSRSIVSYVLLTVLILSLAINGVAGAAQLIWLDFDSGSSPLSPDHEYTAAERTEVEAGLAAIFGPLGHTFTAVDPAPMLSTKVLFNEGGFGTSTAVDFRNLNTTVDLAATDAGFSLDAFGLPRTSEDIVQVSINLAAHELGHVLGARHHDAYNPVGAGIGGEGTSSTFQSLTTVLGIEGDRIIDTDLYLSPRTALKLVFADSGIVAVEGAEPNDSIPTAASIELAPFPVPNTLPPSDPLFGTLLSAKAVTVIGELDAGSADLVDYFKLDGTAGQIVTIEVMSDVLDLRLDEFDAKLELLDGAGAPLAGIITDSIDGPDPTLIDFTLPTDGPYFIEVAAEGELTGLGEYELLVYELGVIPEPPTVSCEDIRRMRTSCTTRGSGHILRGFISLFDDSKDGGTIEVDINGLVLTLPVIETRAIFRKFVNDGSDQFVEIVKPAGCIPIRLVMCDE